VIFPCIEGGWVEKIMEPSYPKWWTPSSLSSSATTYVSELNWTGRWTVKPTDPSRNRG
jgi:hypothetical protein